MQRDEAGRRLSGAVSACESGDDGRSHGRLRPGDREVHEDDATLPTESSHSLSLRRVSLATVSARGEKEGLFGEVSVVCGNEE